MSSTDRPTTTAQRLDHMKAEVRAAKHCLDEGRLEDAVCVLVASLIQCGYLRSRHRMFTNPEDVEP